MLCDAILNAVLWDELETDVTHPTIICHSPEDETVGIVNVPPILSNPHVSMYEPNLSLLQPRGNHFISEMVCALDPVTAIAFGQENSLAQMQTLQDLIASDDPSRHVPEICLPKPIPAKEDGEDTTLAEEPTTTDTTTDRGIDSTEEEDVFDNLFKSGSRAAAIFSIHGLFALMGACVYALVL